MRTMGVRDLTLSIAAWLLSLGSASTFGQVVESDFTELPAHIRPQTLMCSPFSPAKTEVPTAHGLAGFNFAARGESVEIDIHRLRVEGSMPLHKQRLVETEFTVTDVTEHAPVTDTIYVAGWDAREATVVVEEWFLGVPTVTPSKQPHHTQAERMQAPSLELPDPMRWRLFECPHVLPISTFVATPSTNRLWMVSKSSERERHLWVIPILPRELSCEEVHSAYAAGTPTAAGVNAEEIPTNDLARLRTVIVETGELLIYADRSESDSCLIYGNERYPLLWDLDRDGRIDAVEDATWSRFVAVASDIPLVPGGRQAPPPPARPLPENRWDIVGGIGGWAANGVTVDEAGTLVWKIGYDNHWSVDRAFGVEIDWRFLGQRLPHQSDQTLYDPGFLITDVAERSPRTDTVYVAGWDERSGEVVLESWRLSSTSFVDLAAEQESGSERNGSKEEPPPSAEASIASATPRLSRHRLFSCAHVPPIASMAAHPFSERLWILSETAAGEKSIWTLPILDEITECEDVHAAFEAARPAQEPLATSLADASKVVQLFTRLHATRGLVLVASPQGYGCMPSSEDVTYYWDHDLDGTLDALDVFAGDALADVPATVMNWQLNWTAPRFAEVATPPAER